MRLSDIGTVTRGNGLQKADFTDTGIGCIHYGQIYTRYGAIATDTISYVSDALGAKLKKAHTGDIIFAVTSENLEDVCKCVAWLGKDDIVIGGHSAVLHHNQNPKYLAYYFQSGDFQRQKRKLAVGTKVIEVAPNKLEDIELVLPSVEEQERIASILERFDILCHSISDGIPAEIQMRKNQYEYYRDKLLTYKEV